MTRPYKLLFPYKCLFFLVTVELLPSSLASCFFFLFHRTCRSCVHAFVLRWREVADVCGCCCVHALLLLLLLLQGFSFEVSYSSYTSCLLLIIAAWTMPLWMFVAGCCYLFSFFIVFFFVFTVFIFFFIAVLFLYMCLWFVKKVILISNPYESYGLSIRMNYTD